MRLGFGARRWETLSAGRKVAGYNRLLRSRRKSCVWNGAGEPYRGPSMFAQPEPLATTCEQVNLASGG